MGMASKIKKSLYAWIFALVVTLCLSENSVGKNFSYQWNESGQIAAANPQGIGEIGFSYQYEASGYTIAPNNGGTTTLYRAVSKDELLDVADNGFRLGPNAMGNKWFAESAGDASAWGKKFFKWDKEPVFTMEVKVPNSLADKFMRNPKLDGIGPARSADAELLRQLNKQADVKVLNGNVLPSN